MNFADYRLVDAVNWSSLKHGQVSWRHYHYFSEHEQPTTPAMNLGRAVHCSVLESDEYARRYTVWDKPRRGNDWRDFEAAAISAGLEVVTNADYDKCLAIRDAVHSHPDAKRLLNGARFEQTVVWTDPKTGLKCKCRPDIIKAGVLADLKTTTAPWNERDLQRVTYSFGYWCQLAHYEAGCRVSRAIRRLPIEASIIYVQSEQPHDVAVFPLTEDALYAGAQEVARLMSELKDCIETGRWPGRFPKAHPMDLPDWYYAQGEQVMEARL